MNRSGDGFGRREAIMVRGSLWKAALACLALAAVPGGCSLGVDPGDDDALVAEATEASSRFGPAVCVPGECDLLCVQAGRYTVNDEVVRDLQTALVWQREVVANLPHADAATYCAGLQLGGMSGWRLPSTDELNAIRYKPGGLFGGDPAQYCVPCIDQAAFPETPVDRFWSSKIADVDTAWYVGFDDGRMHRDVLDDALWVRCVHDPVMNWLNLTVRLR
jgi:hypothetical protein